MGTQHYLQILAVNVIFQNTKRGKESQQNIFKSKKENLTTNQDWQLFFEFIYRLLVMCLEYFVAHKEIRMAS